MALCDISGYMVWDCVVGHQRCQSSDILTGFVFILGYYIYGLVGIVGYSTLTYEYILWVFDIQVGGYGLRVDDVDVVFCV